MWIEPVRDWNDLSQTKRRFYILCELNLWGIETSGCPPHLRGASGCELNLWGIETFFISFNQTSNQLVWIEPVRDWNCFHTNEFILRLYWCELNLWGIETITVNISSYRNALVWIEPVRDWNGDLGNPRTFEKIVWIEPVRGWNFFNPLIKQ